MIHEILEDVIDIDFSEFIVNKLKTEVNSWELGAYEDATSSIRVADEQRSDTGFIFRCFVRDQINIPVFSSLSDYILYNYIKKSNFIWEDLKLERMFYNYYNSSSTGVYHIDCPDNNHISLLINLNSNNGGTYIKDEFIPSKLGNLISFDSTDEHRGVGPTNYEQRFALNIVFSYTNARRKD